MKDRSKDNNLPDLDDDSRHAAAVGVVDARLQRRFADGDDRGDSIELIAMLRELRSPPARPGFAAHVLKLATSPGHRARNKFTHRAIAATVALFALLVLASTLVDTRSIDSRSAVVEVGNEVRTIKIAIESARAIDDIEMTIELTDNLAVEGFRDLRIISWSARLERGVNVISLPVSAVAGGDGKIVTRVGPRQNARKFVIKTRYSDSQQLGQLLPELAGSRCLPWFGCNG